MTDESLFAAALELPAAERAAILKANCPDSAIRKQVAQLLAAADASNPLDRRPADIEQTIHRTQAPPEPTASVGDRVGPYKLLEKIGEGGMGEVWVADQLEPIKRRVAVKLIKAGMDSRSVLGRFEAERQALAVMDHPNIAKVLDAGRPYFVMELVKGTPITEFADARKLTTKQRLELFVPVCQAIQHAHMKGIIHRDIKPGNVLVALHDETPVPKVIDFGVAKAVGQQLTDKTIYTGFGALVGTPTYMAPEQATFNQLDVDTRADVYALGVLLYELLAGSPPIEKDRLKKAALDEVLRIVRDEEPPRPSQRLSTSQAKATIAATRGSEPAKLSQLMKGELDWIVMKALEKDRTRRYDTANGFAADVQRYLSGEQVQAVPPSLGYRVHKWWRKNRTAGLVASTFALLLTVGIAVATVLAVRASDAERVAKENAERANQNASTAQQAQEQALAERNAAVIAREQQAADQYLADMQLLPSVFEKGNGTDVNAILARHLPKPDSPDRRNFEWNYWNRQLNSETRSLQLTGATFPSTAQWTASEDGTKVACFAPPSRSVAEAPPVPTLTVWELPSGRKLLTHTLPYEPDDRAPGERTTFSILPPKFSPDGKRIAVGFGFNLAVGQQIVDRREGPLVALDVATGKVLLETKHRSTWIRGSLSFNRDGTRLELAGIGPASQNTLTRVYDLDNPTVVPLQILAGPDNPTSEVRWRLIHPDGKSVVVGRLLRPGSFTAVDALAGVASSADVTQVVEIRDLETDEVKRWWPMRNGVADRAVISGNGERLAAWVRAYDWTNPGELNRTRGAAPSDLRPRVKIWDTANGKELGEWVVPDSILATSASSLTFSPDGSRLVVELRSVAGGLGSLRQLVVLSGTTAGFFSELIGAPSGVTSSPVISRDGTRLLKAWDDTLYAWNTNSGELLRTVRTSGAAFRAFGTTDNGRSLWAVDSLGKVREWSLRPPDPLTVQYTAASSFSSPTLSPDGTRIGLLVASDEDARSSRGFRWEIADTAGKLLHTLTPPKESAAWRASDGASMLTAFSRRAERACMIYRPPQTTGTDPVTGGPDRINLNPRGLPELTVWDSATGNVLMHQPLDGVEAFTSRRRGVPTTSREVYHMAFAPDGKTVALANWLKAKEDDNGVRLFDADTGRERPQLGVPAGARVAGMTFDPAGDHIAAVVVNLDTTERPATATVTLMIWDTASGKQLVAEPLAAGRQLVSTNAEGTSAVLAWSPKNDQLAVSVTALADDLFTLRDANTGKAVATPELPSGRFGARTPVPSVMAFHPDGTRLAILLRDGRRTGNPEIHLLDPKSGKSLLTLPTPVIDSGSLLGTPTRRLMFAADGQRLLLTEHAASIGASGRGNLAYELRATTFDASPPPEAKK